MTTREEWIEMFKHHYRIWEVELKLSEAYAKFNVIPDLDKYADIFRYWRSPDCAALATHLKLLVPLASKDEINTAVVKAYSNEPMTHINNSIVVWAKAAQTARLYMTHEIEEGAYA